MIKSNRYGLTVYLDKEMPFDELLMEIENKFRASVHFFEGTGMAVRFENRILTKEEEQKSWIPYPKQQKYKSCVYWITMKNGQDVQKRRRSDSGRNAGA